MPLELTFHCSKRLTLVVVVFIIRSASHANFEVIWTLCCRLANTWHRRQVCVNSSRECFLYVDCCELR